jgi:hypothetical protein
MDGLDNVHVITLDIGDYTTTTYLGAAYPRGVWLEKGFIWEVVDFRVAASTDYAVAATSYVFYLKDTSGNVIATVNNAATTIGVNPATGIDSSPVDAYKRINCETAGSYLSVVPTISSSGKAYVGLQFIIRVKKLRNP